MAEPLLTRTTDGTEPNDDPVVYCTLAEVAAELGVSAQRARQIEKQALRKCRRWCRAHGVCYENIFPDCCL